MNYEVLYADLYAEVVHCIAQSGLPTEMRLERLAEFYGLAYEMRYSAKATERLVEAVIADVATVERMKKRRVVVCNVQP